MKNAKTNMSFWWDSRRTTGPSVAKTQQSFMRAPRKTYLFWNGDLSVSKNKQYGFGGLVVDIKKGAYHPFLSSAACAAACCASCLLLPFPSAIFLSPKKIPIVKCLS